MKQPVRAPLGVSDWGNTRPDGPKKTVRNLAARIAAVAVTLAVLVGLSAERGWAVEYSTGTITAYNGSSKVADGNGTKLTWGKPNLATKPQFNGIYTVSDRKSSDGYKAYAEMIGYRNMTKWRPMPGGGQLPYQDSESDGSKQTSRTSGTLTNQSLAIASKVNPDNRWSIASKICIDIRLRPDKCGGKTVTKK